MPREGGMRVWQKPALMRHVRCRKSCAIATLRDILRVRYPFESSTSKTIRGAQESRFVLPSGRSRHARAVTIASMRGHCREHAWPPS